MPSQAVHRRDRAPDRMLGDFGGQQAVPDGVEQFVDIGELDSVALAHQQIDVVVLGMPGRRARRVGSDVEVVVVVLLVTRVEVEYAGTQAQRRQKPRFQVAELLAAGRRPGHVEPPRLHCVHVDGTHDAFRIGVGARDEVERFVFRRMDVASIEAGNKTVSVAGSTLVDMAFATEHPVLAHSEYRAVDDVVRTGGRFEVVSPYAPAGDQPAAIDDLERRITSGERDVVLLGATGTGKSATTAWLIERLQRPTLVMAPNKTLAAQLANELREMLPHNAVEYFVSYYDYYQPEAYIAQTDTYIEKDSSINDDVERLRHSATSSLLSRRDVVVVASVSCIYGLGTPQSYLDRSVELQVGADVPRDGLLRLLVDVQYARNDLSFTRGSFRVRGDTVEIIPSYEELAVRIEFFGDEIEALYYLHPLTGDVVRQVDSLRIFPATHYVAGPERMAHAISTIEAELAERLAELERQGKLLEAQRLRMRTNYDVEMMRQVGFCSGIENYSRHIDARPAGSAPATLIDYFPEDFLLVIDESHVTVPQIGGMYEGDMSRKRNLVDFGFRLPSAVDNRPLTWEEFADRIGQTVYLSATPGPYELSQTQGEFVEQVIRPTGLVDPKIVVKPTKGQIDDLIGEIRKRADADERVLVTTLTKKMAEDLTDYLLEMGIRVRYLHSEVDTLRRVELLRQLRLGDYDVLIGINLLREGLDLPEVSLVAILDADKEGFLRSARSLIQTIGRAARNVSGEVHMYADKITDSMREAIDETDRRRAKQVAYNEANGIDPTPLRKKIADILDQVYREAEDSDRVEVGGSGRNVSRGRRAQGEPGRAVSAGIYEGRDTSNMPRAELADLIKELTAQMMAAARDLQFELAARIRDEIADLKKELRGMDAAGLK
ncbi:MAG: excinuclease subunit [Mycobacterium sp.]|nr:excinuclease subunit [Mycobacterium sp.]